METTIELQQRFIESLQAQHQKRLAVTFYLGLAIGFAAGAVVVFAIVMLFSI